MKRLFALAAAISLIAQPSGVAAQGFAPAPAPVEYLNFVGGSGVNGTYGVQVGPYVGSFASAPGSSFALYCVDYLHYASAATGLVNATQLDGSSSLANTRLQDFGRYQQTAYLSSLFDGWQTYQSTLQATYGMSFSQGNVWGGLHAAIWDVGNGPSNLGSGNARTAAARDYFLGLAGSNGGSFSTQGWYVLTDVAVATAGNVAYDGTGQEFLVRAPPAAVPETSTVFLFASGLLMLAWSGSRRRRLVTRAT
jgi:hypothetical protein